MSRDPGDLEPGLARDEAEALAEVAERLVRERPVPRPAFRGALGRRLVSEPAGRPRPERLRSLIAVFAGSGLFLLAVAGLSVSGVGPLAA